MAAIDQIKALADSMERATQQVIDDHAERVTRAIQAQLREWSKRYPRHTFTAWEAHGLLEFEVHPPVMGEKSVADLTMSRTDSAALADLAAEARQFQDVWNREWKTCLLGDRSRFQL